jgi:N-glycosylase/DNA lyase
MFVLPAADFSLAASLSSGQTFRWTQHEGWRYGFIGRSVVKIRQDGGRLLYESSDPSLTPDRVRRYFALDLDLSAILSSINVDMQVHQAIQRFRGLRVLRQDGWETLASFICAAFNNIRRIEGMIERLCQAYGAPVALNGFRGFSFPSAEALAGASERALRGLGLGYRAPYLRAAARLVAQRRLPLEQLSRLGYDATKAALLACDGVGDKVADCVALFGFEKYEAFPIDVWMERALRYYFRHRKPTRAVAHAYARRHFGPYAGYAQQYLYHYIRNARLVHGSSFMVHGQSVGRPSSPRTMNHEPEDLL